MNRTDLDIGDVLDVIITEVEDDKDPVTQVDGIVTFVRFPDDYRPDVGEEVKVRIADRTDNYYISVALDYGHDDEVRNG